MGHGGITWAERAAAHRPRARKGGAFISLPLGIRHRPGQAAVVTSAARSFRGRTEGVRARCTRLKNARNDGRIIVSVACAARVRGGQAGIQMVSVASSALVPGPYTGLGFDRSGPSAPDQRRH
jgi:hypothetical protein